MSTHFKQTNIEELEDVLLEELAAADNISEKDVKVIISERPKVKVKQQFVLLFVENLKDLLVKDKITVTELKVLLSIIHFASFKNIFKITQKTIATHVKLDPAVVSRTMKKLRKEKFLLEDKIQQIEYVNPCLFLKGSITDFKRTEQFKNLHLHFNDDEVMKNPF